MINAAFIGGGIPTVIALGGYSVICDDITFDTYSGDSIGALCITCLVAGKSANEIEKFLEKFAIRFCIPYIGKIIMRKEVDKFLGNIKFKDLPLECFVSVSLLEGFDFPIKPKFTPIIITRENCGDMTIGEVVAASATLPILYSSSTVEVDGKKMKVYDGGLSINPPLNPKSQNALFSYNNPSSLKSNSWNRNARWPQEDSATVVFNPYTEGFHMLGGPKDVRRAFEFGKKCMREQKYSFIWKLN